MVLVITRREGEAIVLGYPNAPIARVRIVSVKGGDRVRLAIEADQRLQVHREEVWRSLNDPDAGGEAVPA